MPKTTKLLPLDDLALESVSGGTHVTAATKSGWRHISAETCGGGAPCISRFKCDTCEKKSVAQETMKNHCTNVHGIDNPEEVGCWICDADHTPLNVLDHPDIQTFT
ncbi:MAG: hypothetical protein LBJ95_03910 [Oscillospiraceae bacterium]|nr:hypothetical protein [Oscillospiraceae bacterium]